MKSKKSFISLLIVLSLQFSLFLSAGINALAAEMEGAGTEDSPYLIRTVTDLYNIPQNPDAHYKLMNDLDLENVERSPMEEFSGTLDGGEHIIYGLNVKGNLYNNGLFSRITSATIKNFILKAPLVEGISYCGAICGIAQDSSLSNCYSLKGHIIGYHSVGGLIGHLDNSTLFQCYNSSIVSGSPARTSGSIGGLAGSSKDVFINQCSSEALITGGDEIGGLIGDIYKDSTLKIQDSYATGSLKGHQHAIYRVAGLVPGGDSEPYPEIINCYASTKGGGVYGLVNYDMDIPNSYFDLDVFLDFTYFNERSNARTTEQMYQRSNYEGWDFETVWGINEGKDYPKLKYEKNIKYLENE